MDIKEFQTRLFSLVSLAEANNNCLTSEQIRDTFEGLDLADEHMASVLKYIEEKHITIDGVTFAPAADTASEAGSEDDPDSERAALSPENQDYLDSYLASIANDDLADLASDTEYLDELFERMAGGDAFAKATLTQIYMPISAQIASTYHQKAAAIEFTFPDLIQEANIALLCALEEIEPLYKNDAWLKHAIAEGIVEALKEQQAALHSDHQLISKVETLDRAIREVFEEDEEEYALDQVSAMLDMDIEEIRSILHLTGEDEE